MELFHSQIEPQGLVNINILNSLVLMFSNTLRLEELEHKILPLYSKHRINHDMYTFQHLCKLHLNLRETGKVVELFKKSEADGLGYNKFMLNSYIEAGMRMEDMHGD